MTKSTRRWLNAIAKVNNTIPKALLEQAAFCIADYAGRRPGSWEAEVGRQLMSPSEFQKEISERTYSTLRRQDDSENEAHRKKHNLTH